MLTPKTFLYEEKDDIATITLNRPESLNSLTFDVYRELTDTFLALENESGVRAVILTGTGRGFCSGGSVQEIIAPLLEMTAKERLDFTRLTGKLVWAIRSCHKPVIAAINGVTAGAGAAIALACDFRVLAESTKISFLFVKVGLAGADMGVSWLLPQIVGLGRANELLMLGDQIQARDAYDMGLVHKVCGAHEVMKAAQTYAQKLAKGPSFALGMTKEMLNREPGMSLEEALEAEAQAQQICMGTQDFREGYDAFINQREPKFQGR